MPQLSKTINLMILFTQLDEYENNVAFALGCTFNNYFFNLQIKMKNEDG